MASVSEAIHCCNCDSFRSIAARRYASRNEENGLPLHPAVIGQTEHALGDDVELNLAGAASYRHTFG